MDTSYRSKWPSLANAIDEEIEVPASSLYTTSSSANNSKSHDGREQNLLSAILDSPSYPTFKNNPSAILAATDDFSYKTDFLISVGPQKAGVLSNIIAENKPRTLVEFGGYLGYSAILFAQAMKKAYGDDSTGLKLYSLELNEEFAAIARKLISLSGLSDIVTVVVGPADASLKKLLDDGELNNIDFLFLDHVEDLYAKDFNFVEGLNLLKKGALVVADNVVRPGAPEYRELMRGLKDWESEGIRGLIWPGNMEDEFEVSRFVGTD